MTWKIEFTETAKKQLTHLDKETAKRIVAWLKERILTTHNPRLWGEPLHGVLKSKWRYRIGHYRLICEIKDAVLIVRVVALGHRREVYRDGVH